MKPPYESPGAMAMGAILLLISLTGCAAHDEGSAGSSSQTTSSTSIRTSTNPAADSGEDVATPSAFATGDTGTATTLSIPGEISTTTTSNISTPSSDHAATTASPNSATTVKASTATTTTSLSSTTAPKSTTTAAVVGPTKFGFSIYQNPGESYQDAIERENALYGGGFNVLRSFESTVPTSWTKYTQNHNGDVIISFKDSTASILNGSLDARFKAWLSSAPTDRNVYWTYLHEPEDNIAAGELTASDYRAAWVHLSTIAKTVSRPNVKSELILMSWSLNPSSGRNWTDYYAGPQYIDVLGWDAYNDCAKSSRPSYCTAQSLDRVVQVSKAQNKPWGIAEYGSLVIPGDDGTQRAQWIKQTSEYLQAQGALHAVYFNYLMATGNDYRLTDASSRAVFKALI